MESKRSTVFLLTNDGLGNTDQQPLRHKLVQTFLTLLPQSGQLPAAICLYTDGVRLACSSSPVLAELRALEAQGVRIIICQTCLNTFQLMEQVEVGIVGGMGDILTAMQQADKVVTL